MKTFALYPCHMNSTLTQKEGRKYSIKKCIDNPTCHEMTLASAKLSLKAEVDEKKMHPKNQTVKGRLVFSKSLDRYTVVAALRQEISSLRNTYKDQGKKSAIAAKGNLREKTLSEAKPLTDGPTVKVMVSKKKKNKENKKLAKKNLK